MPPRGWSLRVPPGAVLVTLGITDALMDKGVDAAALQLERTMKKVLSVPGRGRVYDRRIFVRGGRLRLGSVRPAHRAAKKGDPPAPDTGTLRASIGQERHGRNVRVGTGEVSGRVQEFGMVIDSVRNAAGQPVVIPPHPWARPSLEIAKAGMSEGVAGTLAAGTASLSFTGLLKLR